MKWIFSVAVLSLILSGCAGGENHKIQQSLYDADCNNNYPPVNIKNIGKLFDEMPSRGKFETTAEYSARVAEYNGKLPTYAFIEIPIRNFDYNPDSQTLIPELEIGTDILVNEMARNQPFGSGSAPYLITLLINEERKSSGSSYKQNGFGAVYEVYGVSKRRDFLTLGTQSKEQLTEDIRSVGLSELKINTSMPPKEAKINKDKLSLRLTFKIKPPHLIKRIKQSDEDRLLITNVCSIGVVSNIDGHTYKAQVGKYTRRY